MLKKCLVENNFSVARFLNYETVQLKYKLRRFAWKQKRKFTSLRLSWLTFWHFCISLRFLRTDIFLTIWELFDRIYKNKRMVLWNVKRMKMKKIAIALIPVQKKGSAVNVSSTIGKGRNFPHVIFLMMRKKHTIALLRIL